MRVNLALEDPVFQISALFFILDPLSDQGGQVGGHPVDSPSDIAKFIFPLDGGIRRKITACYRLDAFFQKVNRAADGAVEQK